MIRHVSTESRSRTNEAVRYSGPQRFPAAAAAGRLKQEGQHLGPQAFQDLGRPGALDIRHSHVVAQGPHQPSQFPQVRRFRLAGHPRDAAAQLADQPLGPLDLPAEPVQVVGHSAGQVVGAPPQFNRRGTQLQQADRRDRPIGQDPDVFVGAAGAEELGQARHAGRGLGEPARQDLVVPVGLGHRERAQARIPGVQAAFVPNRGRRRGDASLSNELVAMPGDGLQQLAALQLGQFCGDDRPAAAGASAGRMIKSSKWRCT